MIFHAPKRVTTGSKPSKNSGLSIPSGRGTTLEKMIFFAPGTLVDPPSAPTVHGLGRPPAPPNDHWYGCLGVRLGESQGWKPQKVGGCGRIRCPQNSILSHVAQDTARAWFRGVGAHCAYFGAFWRLYGLFLGHIVELEGKKGLLVTGQLRCTCQLATLPLRLAVLTRLRGRFGPKKAVFGVWGTKCAVLGGHLPTWRPRPRDPRGFLGSRLGFGKGTT